jgi:CRP/FNR family transcriptional regulator
MEKHDTTPLPGTRYGTKLPRGADASDCEFLAHIRPFSCASDAELRDLCRCLIHQTYQRGEILYHEDDFPRGLFVVRRGSVKTYLISGGGDRITLSWHHPGSIFGALTAIGERRKSGAATLEASQVLVLDREPLLAFLRHNPRACLEFLAIVSERSSSIMEQLVDVKFLDVESRLAKILVRLSNRARETDSNGCFSIVNQTELGLRIGATRESVNKWLHFFASNGWISCHGNTVRILDEDSLAGIAD